MKKTNFSFLAPFLASFQFACATPATPEKYEAWLQPFVGKPESVLVEKMGAPTGVYESGDSKYLSYSSSKYYLVDRDFGVTLTCTTTFRVARGIVQKYEFQGRGCKK